MKQEKKYKTSDKLKNTDAIRQMLDGTHKTQTRTSVSFNTTTKEKRNVGETWTEIDSNGNEVTWEQKEGYRIKHGKLDELRASLGNFKNCEPECERKYSPSKIDKKMESIHGMCVDCLAKFETKLRIQDKWDEYEASKIIQNALSWLRNAEQEKDDIKKALQKTEYVNSDGTIEKWEPGFNIEEMSNKIDNEFESFKKQIFEEIEQVKQKYKLNGEING